MNVRDIVTRFNMTPHPEGGFYTETYRSAGSIPATVLPGCAGERSFSTAILFLLRQGEYSRLHRIRQDEIWHLYLGGPLRLVSLSARGEYREVLLGRDILGGQEVQYAVPGGCWFGATPCPGAEYALVGCTVAPGFEFADFELGERGRLEQAFPAAREIIREFTPAPAPGATLP